MRVLFLDFDGVLHRAPSGAPGQGLPFEWVDQLKELLSQHLDVAIVIHSTWRLNHRLEHLQDFLAALGERSVTVAGPGNKAAAIQMYVAQNPALSDFRILDDEPAEFFELKSRLIACDPELGITAPAARAQLSAWLNGGEDAGKLPSKI